MFAAFNVKTDLASLGKISIPAGAKVLQSTARAARATEMKNNVKKRLASMLNPDGTVNADRVREDWFPDVKCNVFLSHSHDDKKLADVFVDVLNRKFGITCFVDADVWGYIGTLQRAIDDRWNKGEAGKGYTYEGLMASTAHAHMLLLSALARVMDKCECLMFLNTPESVATEDAAKGTSKTYSPWIFGEAALSSIIRRQPLVRPKVVKGSVTTEDYHEELPPFEYILPLDHMLPLGSVQLIKWGQTNSNNALEALDALYELTDVSR